MRSHPILPLRPWATPKATGLLAIMALMIESNLLFAYRFTFDTLVLLLACGATAFFTSWTGYVVGIVNNTISL